MSAIQEESPPRRVLRHHSHPVGRAWLRRVGGRNMWLWYRFTDDEVVLVTVTTDPPVPLDDA